MHNVPDHESEEYLTLYETDKIEQTAKQQFSQWEEIQRKLEEQKKANLSELEQKYFFLILAGKNIVEMTEYLPVNGRSTGSLRVEVSETITHYVKDLLGITPDVRIQADFIPTLLRIYYQIPELASSNNASNPFSELIDINNVWQDLFSHSHFSEDIKVCSAAGNDDDANGNTGTLEMGKYNTSFTLGSQIKIELTVNEKCNFILLEQGTSGKTWALAPSEYIPELSLETGTHRFPSQDSIHSFFELSGLPGQSTLIAIISSASFNESILDRDRETAPVSLQAEELLQLKNKIDNPHSQCKLLHTQFTITP